MPGRRSHSTNGINNKNYVKTNETRHRRTPHTGFGTENMTPTEKPFACPSVETLAIIPVALGVWSADASVAQRTLAEGFNEVKHRGLVNGLSTKCDDAFSTPSCDSSWPLGS